MNYLNRNVEFYGWRLERASYDFQGEKKGEIFNKLFIKKVSEYQLINKNVKFRCI